ncbi:MAG: carbohydrate kinase family protein [Candidatus Promineifilaceae bacterium]|nr:carbohydrate kinase family protein [Candidatus Promineifilaceae bacterium]
MSEHVLVIGATLLDVKGKPVEGLEPGTSNPGEIRTTRGGTARNVAENLALLGADAYLISAVGDDRLGGQLLQQTADAGVNVEHVFTARGSYSGSYIALIEPDGTLAVALDDTTVVNNITPRYLTDRRHLFRNAAAVMIDGSLPVETMHTVLRLADEYNLPLSADPSSTRLAYKLIPNLDALHLVVPNEAEAAALIGIDFPHSDGDNSLEMARTLMKRGVDVAVITLADFGLSYATADENGTIPPRYSAMVDGTGTGDAITAAIMFGMLNDLPVVECMRLGAAAAGLTLETNHTVVPNLSLDMLYDHLVV